MLSPPARRLISIARRLESRVGVPYGVLFDMTQYSCVMAVAEQQCDYRQLKVLLVQEGLLSEALDDALGQLIRAELGVSLN